MSKPQPSDFAIDSQPTCHELEYLLLGDLRQLLDDPLTEQTRRSMLVVLDRLLLNLPRRLVLACEEGYMSEVLERRPNWHRQIEALHNANLDCISAIDNLRNRIVRELPFAESAGQLQHNLRRWMRSLASIRGHERRLLQEAFTSDIGGEA